MTKLFTMCFFTIGALAIGMMVLGMCEDPTAAEVVVVPTLVPLTEEEQRAEGAYSRGATLFHYKRNAEGMALCQGRKYLASLDGGIKEFKLTGEETANLSLCKLDPESGNYYTMQELGGTLPGDFLVWDDNGLRDTKYTPR